MPNLTDNVSTGKGKVGGYAYIAPAGTTLPTDAETALSSDFLVLGYISEDGITNATERESEDIKDMNGDTVMSPQTGHSETWQATFIEDLNINVLKMVYGDANVTETNGAITITSNGAELSEKVFVFELIERGRAARIIIPCGKITEVGDVVYRAGEAIGHEVTISALPNADGVKSYKRVAAA